MVHNFLLLVVILASIEFGVLYLASNPRTRHFFKFLPSMFWIYFLPMVLSTCGLIDAKSPLYGWITKNLLPPSLFLLLVNMDIKSISRLGPSALIMFFAGSTGIVLGMVVSFVIFKPLVGAQFWSGFGALSASWTGGSANMIAVKEALNTPDAVFLPMVIVDTVVPYMWVGILIALAPWQKIFDGFNRADRGIIDDLAGLMGKVSKPEKTTVNVGKAAMMVVLALLAGRAAQICSVYLPTGKNVMSPYAWSIILVATMAIVVSTTPLSRMPRTGTNKTGKWILYFVLATIGARASLNNAAQAGILIAAGGVVLIIHVIVLLAAARMLRAPLFLAATASVANMAGMVSAPMVAEVYQPGFAPAALLLAVLGHSLGAYIGIVTGQICKMMP
jgi:uncharacterized membrane protein